MRGILMRLCRGLVVVVALGSAARGQETETTMAEEKVLFQETFGERLDSNWSWLREAPNRWRLRDGGLEIHVRPGLAETVENALVRALPEQRGESLAIEVTVRNLSPPTQQYEQVGLTWYVDEKPVFKFVKELVDDQVMIIPGRVPVEGDLVQLRLEVRGKQYTALFRVDPTQPYAVAGKGELPRGDREQISVQCYHGPPDAEHWMRFENFRIMELAKE